MRVLPWSCLLFVLLPIGACGGGGDGQGSCPVLGATLLQGQVIAGRRQQVLVEARIATVDPMHLQDLFDNGLDLPKFTPVLTGQPIPNGGANCGPSVAVAAQVAGGAVGGAVLMAASAQQAAMMPLLRKLPVLSSTGAQGFTNLGGSSRYRFEDAALLQAAPTLSDLVGRTVLDPAPDPQTSIGYGILSDVQASALIGALQQDAETRIVSTPQIVTNDHQSATVFVGTEVPTLQDVTPPLSATILQDGESQIAELETGFTIVLTPTILPSGQIRMDTSVAVEGAAVLRQETFTLEGTDTVVPQVPYLRDRALATRVICPDGDTLVLARQRDDTDSSVQLGVPILAKLPLLGTLLRQHNQLDLRDPLVLMVTATILTDE